jgi:lysophospholipase L1-like esterase
MSNITIRLLSPATLSGINYNINDLVNIDSGIANPMVSAKTATAGADEIYKATLLGEIVHYPDTEAINTKTYAPPIITASVPNMSNIPLGFKGIAQMDGGAIVSGNGITVSAINSTNLTQVTRTAAIGDSITAGTANGNSYYAIFLLSNSGNYFDVGNYFDTGLFGVPGERSDQILARVNAVIATNPKTVFTQFGINDIVQGIPEATLQSNAKAIWAAFTNAGIQVIDIGLPPTNTAANVPRYVQHNLWRSLYCLYNGIRHLDVWDILATNAGGFSSGKNADAIHPNSYGAYLMANALTSFINSNKYCSPVLAYTDTASDMGSYFGNSVTWANTAGTPTGWFANGTGGVLSVVAPDTGGFGSWARCTVTAGTDAGLITTAQTLASLGWAINDRIFMGCRIRWVDAAQALTQTITYTSITPSGQPLYQVKGGNTGADFFIQADNKINAGTFIGNNFTASGTGYFELNRPIVVNLTKMGIH